MKFWTFPHNVYHLRENFILRMLLNFLRCALSLSPSLPPLQAEYFTQAREGKMTHPKDSPTTSSQPSSTSLAVEQDATPSDEGIPVVVTGVVLFHVAS